MRTTCMTCSPLPAEENAPQGANAAPISPTMLKFRVTRARNIRAFYSQDIEAAGEDEARVTACQLDWTDIPYHDVDEDPETRDGILMIDGLARDGTIECAVADWIELDSDRPYSWCTRALVDELARVRLDTPEGLREAAALIEYAQTLVSPPTPGECRPMMAVQFRDWVAAYHGEGTYDDALDTLDAVIEEAHYSLKGRYPSRPFPNPQTQQ